MRKNELVDKERAGDWVPLSRHAAATLARLLGRRGLAPGDVAFVFAAPRNSGKPWSRWHARDLLARAEVAAGVAHVGGAHAWRRKWATERKDHPEADIMRAGAWADPRSLRDAYTHADPETTYEVVSRRTRVVRRGGPTP